MQEDGSKLCSHLELGNLAQENGLENVVGLNIGGSIQIGGVRLFVVQAFHTASRGAPTGVVVEAGGKAIYHAGDTALFGDMRLIGELYKPEVVLIPIGGYYTMGPNEAAEGIRLIKPKTAIPMHYKTFPVLTQTADEFVRMVGERVPEVKVIPLRSGESYQF